jgi:hypothetical protein
MEFKGTKGKWQRVLKEKTEFYTRTNEIHFGNDGECVAEFVHNDFDALLISKAPEMLEMLKDILDTNRDLWGKEESSCYQIQDIEKLIKEATEL